MAGKEMAQWLVALTASARAGFQFPALTQWPPTICNSCSRRSDTSSLHLSLHSQPHLYAHTAAARGAASLGSLKRPCRPASGLLTAFTSEQLRSLLQGKHHQVNSTQTDCVKMCVSKSSHALNLLLLGFLLCVPWLIHLGQKDYYLIWRKEMNFFNTIKCKTFGISNLHLGCTQGRHCGQGCACCHTQ